MDAVCHVSTIGVLAFSVAFMPSIVRSHCPSPFYAICVFRAPAASSQWARLEEAVSLRLPCQLIERQSFAYDTRNRHADVGSADSALQ